MSWINESGPFNGIVMSSRVRIARNIAGLPFPSIASPEVLQKAVDMVKKSILESNSILSRDFDFVSLRNLSDVEKYILVEKHLISPDLVERAEVAAALINHNEQISIMVNEEDHIRMQCIFPGFQLDKAWELLNRVDDIVEESIEYSFDEHLGYLTSCPTNVGTGMRASVMMHLPGLVATKYINSVLQTISKVGLTARGLYGEGSEALGDIYQISNQITLGPSEEEIISNINIAVRQLMENERMARQALMQSNKLEFEDRIWRSLGILTHARKLSLQEFMSLLSQVRLGVDMGIINGIDVVMLNELMVKCQPAHLQAYIGRETSAEELDVARADRVRNELSKVT
nr:MAG: protein arginine kinase [Caldicoprobacter oshimai]